MWHSTSGHNESANATAASSSAFHPSHPSDDTDKVVLLPIGHTEQHGYHLPLSTDTIIIDAIAAGVAALGYRSRQSCCHPSPTV